LIASIEIRLRAVKTAEVARHICAEVMGLSGDLSIAFALRITQVLNESILLIERDIRVNISPPILFVRKIV
jgi:hypothetical protein